MIDIEYVDYPQAYAIFDKSCRKYMQMTGEEFLHYYRAGVYDEADLDYWGWVDVYFVMPFNVESGYANNYLWEPALLSRDEFMNEVLGDCIGEWHSGMGYNQTIEEYLGLTWDEYGQWVECRGLPKAWTDRFMNWENNGVN